MESETQRDQLLELLSRLAEAELTPDEAERLEEILTADPEARLLYMQHIDLQVELACLAETAKVDGNEPPDPSPKKIIPFPLRWLGAVAALVAVGVGLFLWRGPDDNQLIARLDHIKGDVLITPKDGLPWSPHAVVDIRSSYSIRLRGDGSSAVLVYPDGTLVALVGDTEVSFGSEHGKQLELPRGVLAASVTKQPSKMPMTISTPNAEVEIVGTEFTLESDAANTHLAVLEGAVDFVRNTDTQRVQVTEGKVATVGTAPESGAEEPKLVAEQQSPPPTDWAVDFNQGLPPGWKRGELVNQGLPVGMKGAALAERTYSDSRTYHQIEAPSSFVYGQYQINADTHLHVTYKMDHPDWVNIFIGARSADLRGATWDTFLNVAINAQRSPAGVWQTITIPLAAFKDASGDGESIIGKVPYGLLLSSTADPRGLVVGAIWVTQGGPGIVETKKLSP